MTRSSECSSAAAVARRCVGLDNREHAADPYRHTTATTSVCSAAANQLLHARAILRARSRSDRPPLCLYNVVYIIPTPITYVIQMSLSFLTNTIANCGKK